MLNQKGMPTCTRVNGQSGIDLTMTNQPEWVMNEQATVKGDFNSDHSPVSVNIKGFNIGGATTKRFRRHWAKANWDEISNNTESRLDWKSLKRIGSHAKKR